MPLSMYKQAKEKSSSIKYVIAVAAGKGGVGKSTMTANLGLALKKLGFKVGIMDTDIYGPSIRKMLPEDLMPVEKNNVITPALSQGMPMMSMGYFRREDEAAAVRAPIANSIIHQFIDQVAWGELDFLLIDFPPGTGDVQLTLAQKARLSGAVMVTTPQQVAVMDVKKAMHLFEQVNVPIIGIVENMSYYCQENSYERTYLFGKKGGERLAREAGLPFLGEVPVDTQISLSGDVGKSLFESEDTKAIASVFIQIASKMVEQTDLLRCESKEFELVWK